MSTLTDLLAQGREALSRHRKEHAKEEEQAVAEYTAARTKHWNALLAVIAEDLPRDLWQYANLSEPPPEFSGAALGRIQTRAFDLLLDAPGCSRVQARFCWYSPEGWQVASSQGNIWLVAIQHPINSDEAAFAEYGYEEVADLSLALALAEEEYQQQQQRQAQLNAQQIQTERAVTEETCIWSGERLLDALDHYIEEFVRRMPQCD